MGAAAGFICRACGARFMVSEGGGFVFDLLHCDTCGAERHVSHQELGDIHFAYVKGLPGPYAVSRMDLDSRIKQNYPGKALTRDEYRVAAERSLEPCGCGGRFAYDAPVRCPQCRSTRETWDADPSAGYAFYD